MSLLVDQPRVRVACGATAPPGTLARALALALVLSAAVAGCGPPRRTRPPRPAPAPSPAVPSAPPGPVSAVPPRPDGARDFRLVVISDTNSRYGSVELAVRGVPEALAMIRGGLRPHLVVHNGDQIAAGGRRSYDRAQIDAMWDAFHVTLTDVLRSAGIPLLPVPGNHDVLPAALAPVYSAVWSSPAVRPDVPWTDAADYPRRYALRYRGVALVVLDAPTGRLSAGELGWLAARLAAARDADLRIVFSHVPIAPLTDRDYGHLKPQDGVYDTLRAGGCDLLVTSHDEVYFRGAWRDQPVLATGGLGSTCRNLRGASGCQGMSFAVIDIVGGRVASAFAMTGRDFGAVFDEATLPAEVGEYWREERGR